MNTKGRAYTYMLAKLFEVKDAEEVREKVAWMRANLPSNFVQLWSKIDHEQRSQ
jgi:hypothetical protein